MGNDFIEAIELLRNKNSNQILQLGKVLKRFENSLCRGEIIIRDKNNNLLLQIHYEDFIVSVMPEQIILRRYDRTRDTDTPDWTHIDSSKITWYDAKPNSLQLKGELDENIGINVQIFIKEARE